jgi:6-phosphogluconate dehydrogenase
MSEKAQFGMIGMAVMGSNLALNILDHGFRVAGYNREPEMLDAAVARSDGRIRPAKSYPAFVGMLERPRRIMMMIKAGKPVDMVLDELAPLLDEGDIVIDGGNSWFEDTRRRQTKMARHGIHFFGAGVSGGEDGARHGPSLMPGGDAAAYDHVKPVFEAIAAKTDAGACVTHVGPDGAGHFVKMVHNGIEYADMQLIAEAYDLMAGALGMAPPAIHETFSKWNEGPLESFLIEITARIFGVSDGADGWLVDQVLDKAGQKGTGRWTAKVALDLGVPIPTIAAAIDARVLSSMKAERGAAAPRFTGPSDAGVETVPPTFLATLEAALEAAKIISYAQGIDLIAAGSKEYDWGVDMKEIARIWKGGCIIRARFLDTIMRAFDATPDLVNLMMAPDVSARLQALAAPLREVVIAGQSRGIPVHAFASSLAYFDSYRTADLPQNLTQAQRDAFGSHTYKRKDDPEGESVHTDWLD